MAKRVFLFLVAAVLLAGLIAYSQLRHELLKVSGFIEADEMRLGSRVGGRVDVVYVEEGQRVAAGQVLIELEPFDLLELVQEAQAELGARQAEYERLVAGYRDEDIAQAKARYDQLKARLDRLVKGPRQQEIEAARARLQAAEAELKLALQTHGRTEELFGKGATTREAMDRAIQVLQASQANLLVRQQELALLEEGTRSEEIDEAKAQLEEAHQAWQLTQKGFRQEEIDQAQAARDAAAAALTAIKQRQKELKIVAPVDGVIEALELQKGDLVSAGAPVLSIMDVSNLWVRAYVPENRLNLELQRKLWVTVDSFPDQRFAGQVTFISRQAEFTPSNVQTPEERSKQVFRVKVTLLEGLDRLRAGMGADIWLESADDPP